MNVNVKTGLGKLLGTSKLSLQRPFSSIGKAISIQNTVKESTKNIFAVFSYENEQYKVSQNDIIMIARMAAEIGEEVSFKKCLMIGGQDFTAVGRPYLENSRITAVVEEHKKSHNVIYYLDRHKRKNVFWKNSQAQVTVVRVIGISYEPQVLGTINKERGTVDNV